jgi:hypothetical protein
MDKNIIHLYIDGKWDVEDFADFLKTYLQIYYLFNSLFTEKYSIDNERINYAYSLFPWKGGYSAVNFYQQLKFAIPKKDRPKITAIHFSSPGYIELLLLSKITEIISEIITYVAGSIGICNGIYNKIYTDMQKRKLLRLKIKRKELRLDQEKIKLDNIILQNSDLEFINESNEDIAQILGLGGELKELNKKTGHPYITLKILLSLYRRIRTLAGYEKNNKLKL